MKGDFKARPGKDIRSFCAKLTLTAQCIDDEILLAVLAYFMFPPECGALGDNREALLRFMRGDVVEEDADAE